MKKYNDADIIMAVQNSKTAKESLLRLGLVPAGGNYNTLRKAISRLKISTDHWDPNAGRITTLNRHSKQKRIPISDLLVENCKHSRSAVKRGLLRTKLIEYKCGICGISHWHGQKLSLHLDHINGNRTDNRLENLQLLCPNCHSLTPTYAGRNLKILSTCPICGGKKSKQSMKCVKCNGISKRKIIWPSKRKLKTMVEETSYSKVARTLGVSDNAVRKYLNT